MNNYLNDKLLSVEDEKTVDADELMRLDFSVSNLKSREHKRSGGERMSANTV